MCYERGGCESSATIWPMLANTGAVSTFVGAFDVTSKLTGRCISAGFRISETESHAACGYDRHEILCGWRGAHRGLSSSEISKHEDVSKF
jgi:hypothetical protein